MLYFHISKLNKKHDLALFINMDSTKAAERFKISVVEMRYLLLNKYYKIVQYIAKKI